MNESGVCQCVPKIWTLLGGGFDGFVGSLLGADVLGLRDEGI
jgi:hypothetical protein